MGTDDRLRDAEESLHLAVIGFGYWGPNLVRNLLENRLTRQVTVCDLDPAKLARAVQRYPGIQVTCHHDEVLASPDIDGVLIATPLVTHYPLALQALQAGKHVFVEKPFTGSSEQALELIQLAKRKDLTVMVGHTFRYSPPVVKIREILEKGELGQVFYISSTRVNLGLHQKDVSVIWDLAPHDLSMLLYWLGETPREVLATGKDFVQKGIPDVAFIYLKFDSGAIVHVQVSWLAPSKLRRTTIVGSAKMLVYDDTENIEQVKIFDKGVDYKDPDTFGEYQLSYRTGDIVSPKLETFEPLQAEVSDFLTSILTGQPPLSSGEQGLQVVQILEAAERSMANNGHAEILEPLKIQA
jgi:predicted dehydrogenase